MGSTPAVTQCYRGSFDQVNVNMAGCISLRVGVTAVWRAAGAVESQPAEHKSDVPPEQSAARMKRCRNDRTV